MVDLSIVIVSWNVKELLVDCLNSITQNTEGLETEVVVIDNNSSDGTVETMRTHFPDIPLIANDTNMGFALACNIGISRCKGRNILLLNPDTVVLDGALKKMVGFADSHPEVGLVGPKLQSPDGGIQYYCARSFPTPLDWFWYYSFIGQMLPRSRIFGRLYLSYWDHADGRPVEAIAGAAMLIPRRTLQEVGLLDETLPMYLEDTDYCLRVHRVRQVYYLAEATIIHHGGRSSSQAPFETKVLILEAHRLFFRRHGRSWDETLFRLAVVVASLIRLPVLGLVKLWSTMLRSGSAKVRRINLRSEVANSLWGLGLVDCPQIGNVKV